MNPEKFNDLAYNIGVNSAKVIYEEINNHGSQIASTTEETNNIISEINSARKGEVDLPTKIGKIDAVLVDKASYSEARLNVTKIELEDMSNNTISAITGGSTVNVLSIPQSESVTFEKIDKTLLKSISLNKSNLFKNPMLLDNNTDWKTGVAGASVFDTTNTCTKVDVVSSLCNGFKMPLSASATLTLNQARPLIDFSNGAYTISIKRKLISGTQVYGKVQVLAGLASGASYGTLAITSATNEENPILEFTLDKTALLATYPSATHLIFSFTQVQSREMIFYEPMLCLSSVSNKLYYDKSFIESTINDFLNNVNSNNKLYGKIISFDGDSICYGAGYTGGYGKIISDANTMTYENKAVSGATITGGVMQSDGTTPRHWVSRSISAMRADADYIILEGGFNDFGNFVNMGTITADYISTLDDTTFCGAFESMLKQAKARFPGKKIGFIIPHKINNIFYPYGRAVNTGYAGVDRYREKSIEICNKWSVPYLDLFNLSGLNTSIDYLKTTYTNGSDGIHPNELGYRKYYVPLIEAWLKTL